MKIRIGEKGQARPVRVEVMARWPGDVVYIGGYMGDGLTERIGIEIDADTLAEIVRAAVKGVYIADLEKEPNAQ